MSDFNDFELSQGVDCLSAKVKVNAHLFLGGGVEKRVEIETTRAKLHNACHSRKRYTFVDTVRMVERNSPKMLGAICYRAKVSEHKNHVVGANGCVQMGVVNA